MSVPNWLPRAVWESGLIVFSILLALAVNEWQEGRERAARVALALESIRAELLENRREVEDALAYHTALKDTMFVLAAAGVTEIGPELYPRGMILSPDVVGTAWHSAQATGAAADMPYGTVLVLSRAYTWQEWYERRKEGVLQSMYERVLQAGPEVIPRQYSRLAGVINDVAHWERRLIRIYDEALAELEGGGG